MSIALWVAAVLALAFLAFVVIAVLQRRGMDPIGPIARWFDPAPATASAPAPAPVMEA